jgi:predicted DNA-binding transcriptional regulator YafY
MRQATVTDRSFTPREEFDPGSLRSATIARVWYSPVVARWEIEKGARPLVDGAAIADRSVGSAEWLVGEVVAYRGEAIVLEPAELRARVAQRARELANELRPNRAATTR